MMLLLLGLACVAARAAPTSLHRLSESELDGYCRRRLDGGAPLINGGEGLEPAPANGTAPPVSVNADGQFLANGGPARRIMGPSKERSCLTVFRSNFCLGSHARPRKQYGFSSRLPRKSRASGL